MSQPAPQMIKGIVKQVLSGDSVIIRGQPRGGPPPERQLCLSNVNAPKLARRANPNIEGSVETRDEPFAWESREFLRKKLIGKEVLFSIEYKVPGTGREYGCVFLLKAEGELENITESIVAEGLVEVRRGGIKPSDDQTKLIDLEELAKDAGKGKWAKDAQGHVREIIWNVDNPRHFVDAHQGKEFDAIIEHVRDGCTVRAFLLPSFHHVTLMMSGIKCPMFKREGDKEIAEPYADEAKYFTESRLLQREVKILLQGVSNQNYIGQVIHPAGNISEFLLREGFARCVDWSMAVLTTGHDKLRQAEKFAKDKRLRIWKNYTPAAPLSIQNKEFSGKVVEVVNGDAVVVKLPDGTPKKIHLSSLRPPRLLPKEDGTQEPVTTTKDGKRSRPLYDIPYMFEAREFLRKKLIGKKVNVVVDYIKPPNEGFPERTCGTITIGGINVAEALISKGFATVLRHRQDDDQRSSHYDELLAAETRAIKNTKGLHSKKETPIHRVADLSGEASKAKQFFPFLQRAGRSTAVVEFVASGSRLRLYLPKETCLITFLLAGISCPRAGRVLTSQGVINGEGEPYGDEALVFTRDLVLQREVEVQVDSVDKAGNFIGWLFVLETNLSVALVEEGLSSVHFTADRTVYYSQLQVAEESAKSKKLRIWANYEEPKEVVVVEETERKCNYKKVIVTEVGQSLNFWAQSVDTGSQLDQLMTDLQSELTAHPPLPGSYTAHKGDLCAAMFEDNSWYRARVEALTSPKEIRVFYIDYGNREVLPLSKLCPLPPAFQSFPPQALEYYLAFVALPKDVEQVADALDAFRAAVLNRQFLLNVEYKAPGQLYFQNVDDAINFLRFFPHVKALEFVTLMLEGGEDSAKALVAEGLVTFEKRKEKKLQKLMEDYTRAQDAARKARKNLWRYGDFTEDDAREFGYPVGR